MKKLNRFILKKYILIHFKKYSKILEEFPQAKQAINDFHLGINYFEKNQFIKSRVLLGTFIIIIL
jgi:hypothetical protein